MARDAIPGGLAQGMPDSAFDPEQLQRGMQVELEHTSNRDVAKEIAKDHLIEDPLYYVRLVRMERAAELSPNRRCPRGMEVQTLLFDRDVFTQTQAKRWAKQHGYRYGNVDSPAEYHRIRQRTEADFTRGSGRTINFGDETGIKAVVGCPKAGHEMQHNPYDFDADADDLDDDLEPNRRWTTKYMNELPDSAFLYVDESRVSYVDDRGRSHPLDSRHLPVKNKQGHYDCDHIKNAISRAPQTHIPRDAQRRAQDRARTLYKKVCGGYANNQRRQIIKRGGKFYVGPFETPGDAQAATEETIVEQLVERERPFDPSAPPERYAQPHHFAVNADDARESIIEGIARSAWAISWADAAEERGESLSGMELYEEAPEAPGEAQKYAEALAEALEKANDKSLWDLFTEAAVAPGRHTKQPEPEDFGSDLALMSLGTGVSWFDDHPEFPLVVPSSQFYVDPQSNDVWWEVSG